MGLKREKYSNLNHPKISTIYTIYFNKSILDFLWLKGQKVTTCWEVYDAIPTMSLEVQSLYDQHHFGYLLPPP